MNTMTKGLLMAILLLTPPITLGCGKENGSPENRATGSRAHSEETASTDPNKIAVPSSVRSNLGITFIRVERRAVEKTLRVPGRFEYLPTARREYRTALPGRIEILVDQFDRVEAGTPLYRIDSPAWRDLQMQIVEQQAAVDRISARINVFTPLLAAHQQHEESLHESVAVWEERVAQLQSIREAGGGRVDELTQARASLASTRAELASIIEKKAELHADQQQSIADLTSARTRSSFLLDSASAILSRDRAELESPRAHGLGESPTWATIGAIEVVAASAGIVEDLGLTNGSWADEKSPVLTIVRPERLRFRASGLQSDLGTLRDGLPARIVSPSPTAAGRSIPLHESMNGTVSLGPTGDPNDRTIDLFVTPDALHSWARAGVSARLEVITDTTAPTDLAIPLAAIQRDGLTPVIFRRNPSNPNEVIRMEADLGKDDGRWVAILSGVREGDEIVLDGAFQLMLATSGTAAKGGHFHSDGTFHDGEH